MPSIKTCLASIALVALAFSPVAYATPLKADDGSLARRTSNPSFYSNEAGVEKRSSESRKEAAARVKKAKIAAAKKAKRVAGVEDSEDLLKRHIDAMHAEQGVTKRDLERRELFARALRRYRCANDRVCSRAVTAPSDLPANGRAVCNPNTRLCAVGCQPGFQLSNGACISTAPTCGPNTCPTTENGIYLCSGGNTCTLVCNTAGGYQQTPAGTCVNTRTDAENCGSVGNVCPGSYNGLGSAICRSGLCRLSCPFGTVLRRTQDGTALYCYGTPSA